MRIHPTQYEMFSQAARRHFEDRMVQRVGALFPDDHEGLGEAGVRDVVRGGVDAARRHGIEEERDVAHYIDLMFHLSFDFDTEEAWAAAILGDDRLAPAERLRLIELSATSRLPTEAD